MWGLTKRKPVPTPMQSGSDNHSHRPTPCLARPELPKHRPTPQRRLLPRSTLRWKLTPPTTQMLRTPMPEQQKRNQRDRKINILSLNVARSNVVAHESLQIASTHNRKFDIMLHQEPWWGLISAREDERGEARSLGWTVALPTTHQSPSTADPGSSPTFTHPPTWSSCKGPTSLKTWTYKSLTSSATGQSSG